MRHILLIFLGISVSVPVVAEQSHPKSARIVESYGRLPLAFEANQGQSDLQVKFLSRGAGYSLFLTATEAVLGLNASWPDETHASGTVVPPSLSAKSKTRSGRSFAESKSTVLRMKLIGANAQAEVIGQDELPGKSNYFIGNDPKKWHTNVRQFAKVRYESVYPGVDLVYYGHQRELEYDFVLQPGANPQNIRLGIEGAKRLRLEHGDLVLTSTARDVRLRTPHVYQEADGTKYDVRGRYVLKNKNEVGFSVGGYNRRRPLVIDPVLAYSTYLSGSEYDAGKGIAVDFGGNAYVTGTTQSADFPTAHALQPMLQGSSDAFVTKFNPDGSGLVYSTYLGGSRGENGSSIGVDGAGNAFVTGGTSSADFPIVNAIQPALHGESDAFVAKMSANGSALLYSTYLGGSVDDGANGIAVDGTGNAYVTGITNSTDFPTENAIQPAFHGNNPYATNAFVTEIRADGKVLVYSTYLGGGNDGGIGIAADATGNAYVTGYTGSVDFPTVNAIQPTLHGSSDAFVAKINAHGIALVYSTYLGGDGNEAGTGIAADVVGSAYVTGFTGSTDFPTVNAIQAENLGVHNAFVTKLSADGTALVYSTYLGGSVDEHGQGIAADAAGNTYVTGYTGSADFPIVNAIQSTFGGGADAFVTKISADGTALGYSTYLGGRNNENGLGIAVDSAGSVYVTGGTNSPNFPKTLLAFQTLLRPHAFVTKIAAQTSVDVAPAKLPFAAQVIGTTGLTKEVTLTNKGAGTLTIDRIYIGGLNPSDFAETNTCGTSLPAGGGCTIKITFTPKTKNTRKAGLGISSSDPGSPSAIALSGIGTVVSLSKSKLSFGDQSVGSQSPPQNVTLKNTGATQLNFTGITITGANAGDFSQTNACGTSIAAGASCTITVSFTPTATGTRKATISISDDGGGSPQKITLTGTGT